MGTAVTELPQYALERLTDCLCTTRNAGFVKGCRTPTRAGTPSLHADPPRVGVVQASGEETAGECNLCGLMRGYGGLNGRRVAWGTDSAN